MKKIIRSLYVRVIKQQLKIKDLYILFDGSNMAFVGNRIYYYNHKSGIGIQYWINRLRGKANE